MTRPKPGMRSRYVAVTCCTLFLLTPGLSACSPPTAQPTPAAAPPGSARNVIFINGDGMGAAQREAGRLYLAGLDKSLQMGRLPTSGTLTTESLDPKTVVTDSAAGASAWATGEKTYNGAISVDVTGVPLPIIGEQAHRTGRATGLVTTAQVTDASPAAFFARSTDRHAESDIARQYLEDSHPDVILGGGEDWWYPRGRAGRYPDKPKTDRSEKSQGSAGNLVGQAQRSGYTYVSTAAQLDAAPATKLLGLFANEEMFEQRSEGDGDRYQPVVPLATMTAKALGVLDATGQGFFLFVEEEGVDEFAHHNNGPKMLQAIGQLDAAVAVARRYVAAHPDTLLIVTGDHESGGLTIEDTSNKDESGTRPSKEDGPFRVRGSKRSFVLDWTTTSHTTVPVTVSAVGPGAAALTGEHPNTFVHDVLTRALT